MRRFWETHDLPPLPDEAAARLAEWVAHLDVDLEAAQAALRLPATDLPPLPGTPAPAPVVGLRGAYARRAAARAGGG